MLKNQLFWPIINICNKVVLSCNNLSYIFVFIIIIFVDYVQPCMPGYETERAKLRQYLGIEWNPNGLDKMTDEKMKPVRHPNDLNCDFMMPELCRWYNLNNFDTLDFHLFHKEDNTEFPIIQVRPGLSKVEIGDQMLFVGDKKREEQSAILASWPIRCQNSTGLLTFTFWIYNGASVEVLLLEKNVKTNELQILREKPYIDCGALSINTECKVEIPPRETPFQIGIRAFDIKNTDGSFVMIDNIYYSAYFCKVSIDFGNNFKNEDLMTAEEGQLIQTSSQLACHNFDVRCRWRNGGKNGQTVWRRGLSSLPSDVLFNVTGTYTSPNPPFAYIYIEENMPFPEDLNDLEMNNNKLKVNINKGQKKLVSDPILCQSPSNPAIIFFRVWATSGVEMSICVANLKMEEIECQKISTIRSPAPVYHQFNINEKFMYMFQIDSVNSDFDNFVIIDDIEYHAKMCSEAADSLDLGPDFYTTPLLSTLLHREIHSANDLSCDFSRRALNCRWANFLDESTYLLKNNQRLNKKNNTTDFNIFKSQSKIFDTKWEIGLGKFDEVKFPILNNSQNEQINDIAIAKLLWKNASAMLVSESIRCLLDSNSMISFRYWQTGGTILSFCVIESYSFEVIDCQTVTHSKLGLSETDQIFIDLPRFNQPIRLAFKATAPDSIGIVALDNIIFKGHICSHSVNIELTRNSFNIKKTNKRPSVNLRVLKVPFTKNKKNNFFNAQYAVQNYGTKNNALQSLQTFNENLLEIEDKQSIEMDSFMHNAPDENVCRLLSCNFDSSHMCLYTSTKLTSQVNMFNVFNQSLHTVLFDRGKVAILESTRFSLNAPGRLHFDFTIQRGIAHLHVCQDSIRRELDSCYAINSAKTILGRSGLPIHDFIELVPTDTKVYIVAKLDPRSRKAHVKIDNLELTDVEDHVIC